MNAVTHAEVKRRIKGLGEGVQKAMVCAMVGHSRIQTTCFGYYYCARCGEQTGDTLASVYPGAASVVIVGHNCETCRKNAEHLTWHDKFLTPDPFKAEPTS